MFGSRLSGAALTAVRVPLSSGWLRSCATHRVRVASSAMHGASAKADAGDLAEAMTELERLAAGSKSFFPGRVMLNRSKTYALLDRMKDALVQHAEQSPHDFDACHRALQAVVDVNELANSGSAGASIWRTWFADVSRKKLSAALAELRSALEPVSTAQRPS